MEKIEEWAKENNIECVNAEGVKHPAALLLDSSLITQSKKVEYDMKIIECGDYIQLYKFRRKKLNDKDLELLEEEEKKKINFDEFDLYKLENLSNKRNLNTIEYKNIMRSKFQLERLIKANEGLFKTFITLTFAENVDNIDTANKKFNTWRTYVKQLKKDFAYVCVPEYQKRGAVHYHLLTNLDISKNPDIIIPQKDKNGKILKNRYDVKGWSYGFARVDKLKDINVITYLSKYMTKDCDNRLYGHRRYLNSTNLKKVHESYIDLSNLKHYEYLDKKLKEKELSYNNSYVDYFGDEVNFFEFRSQHNIHYTKSIIEDINYIVISF